MSIIDFLGRWFIKKRIHQIEYFKQNPEEVQHNGLRYLIQNAQNTEYGRKFGFRNIKNITQFQNQVPVLNPLGYLLGTEDIGDSDDNEDSQNFFQKTKRWAKNKFK